MEYDFKIIDVQLFFVGSCPESFQFERGLKIHAGSLYLNDNLSEPSKLDTFL